MTSKILMTMLHAQNLRGQSEVQEGETGDLVQVGIITASPYNPSPLRPSIVTLCDNLIQPNVVEPHSRTTLQRRVRIFKQSTMCPTDFMHDRSSDNWNADANTMHAKVGCQKKSKTGWAYSQITWARRSCLRAGASHPSLPRITSLHAGCHYSLYPSFPSSIPPCDNHIQSNAVNPF